MLSPYQFRLVARPRQPGPAELSYTARKIRCFSGINQVVLRITPAFHKADICLMEREQIQRLERLVQGVVAFTEGTSIAADCYEQYLLKRYVRGKLSLEEVLLLLKAAQSYPSSRRR